MQYDRDTRRPLAVCDECNDLFDPQSAKLGARCCPTCDRRAGRGW